MAGKHRGPNDPTKKQRVARYVLDPKVERELFKMCDDENRSLANAISILITEALERRRKNANRIR